MAAHIARAVPAVIGCDRAAVILFEPGAAIGRVVATHGYSVERRSAPALDGGSGRADPRRATSRVTVWDRAERRPTATCCRC